MKRFNIIPVYIHEPLTDEERLIKRSVNRRALIDCLRSLEQNIPLAIAPSGGSTHAEAEGESIQTIVPTLASLLYKRGKTAKIIPCVIKAKPPVTKKTYVHYLADRVGLIRWFKKILSCLLGKELTKFQVTVEFLPPQTFPKVNPTKNEKIEFVHRLQRLIFEALGSSFPSK